MPRLPPSCDVAVVGSGPAGACAAREAAMAGLDVVVLEKTQIPRYKTCGGGILGRAARLLGETSIPVAEKVCHAAEFALSPDLDFKVVRPEPIVYMTMRDAFDQWLISKAVAVGARVYCDCLVNEVAAGNNHAMLSTSEGQIRAQYLIAADGAGGQTARKAGWPNHRRLIPALECEVSVCDSDFARLSQSARFDFHAVPQGYAWVFPKRSHLSIGVLTFNSSGVNLNDCFQRYLAFLKIEQPINIQRHGFVIPLSPRDNVFARNRVLLTGDAAGLADPVTAEGISNAILSGKLAGKTVGSAFRDDHQVCATYDACIHQHILPDLRWAARLAKLLYGAPHLRDSLFRWQGQRLTEAMGDVVAGTYNYANLMANPENYLKLLAPNPRPGRQNLRDSNLPG